MPVLKERRTGGHYLVGSLFGRSVVTWQIGSDGLGYLRACGVSPGSSVSTAQLQYLHSLGWVWTGQTGVDQGSGGACGMEVPLAGLISWAETGDPTRLLAVLAEARLDLRRCYSQTFVEWARGMVPGASLAPLTDLTYAAFVEYGGRRSAARLNGLHQQLLAADGGLAVLWHWVRLAGHVVRWAEMADELPAAWRGTAYEAVDHVLRQPPVAGPATGSVAPGPATLAVHGVVPYLQWLVDDQEVRLVLPGGPLAKGARVTWTVEGREQTAPVVHPAPAHDWLEEACSGPLACAAAWDVAVRTATTPEQCQIVRHHVKVPADAGVVVFDRNGRAVDGRVALLSPGTYWVLTAEDAVSTGPLARAGIEVIDEAAFEPVGWAKWSGALVSLAAGAQLGPYHVGSLRGTVSWELVAPADPVEFVQPTKAYVGCLPLVTVTASDDTLLADAQVAVGPPGAALRSWPLQPSPADGANPGLLVVRDGQRTIDLSLDPRSVGAGGRCVVRLMAPHLPPSGTPAALHFIALPGCQVSYSIDDEHPEESRAVEIVADGEVVAGPDSRVMCSPGSRHTIYLRDRLVAPLASFSVLPRGASTPAVLSVRVPVSRAALQSHDAPLPSWQRLPLTIERDAIRLDTVLLLELADEPLVTSRGELVCRLSTGEPMVAGRSNGRASRFRVPLHQWLPSIGPCTSAAVSVHCAGSWRVIANVVGHMPPEPVPAWHPTDRHQGLFDALSARGSDRSAAEACAAACECALAETGCPDWFAELYLTRLARLHLVWGDLQGTVEVIGRLRSRCGGTPDGQELQTRVHVRSGKLDGHELLQAVATLMGLPDSPGQRMALAESTYRLARAGKGGVGALAGCRRGLLSLPDGGRLEGPDAALLLGLVTVLLDEIPPAALVEGLGSWGKALGLVAHYLHHPRETNRAKPRHAAPVDPPCVWARVDAMYVAVALGQIAGCSVEHAQAVLRTLCAEGPYMPRKELLLARQLVIDGELDEAKQWYRRILDSRDAQRGADVAIHEIP